LQRIEEKIPANTLQENKIPIDKPFENNKNNVEKIDQSKQPINVAEEKKVQEPKIEQIPNQKTNETPKTTELPKMEDITLKPKSDEQLNKPPVLTPKKEDPIVHEV